MAFRMKPDYEMSKRRYEAFWEQAVIDRPPVSLIFLKEDAVPVPRKQYATLEEQWLDIDFRAEVTALSLANVEFYGDGLPVAYPNMGPEIFSAWCGCPYRYGQNTTWTEPCIVDWERDGDKAVLDLEHPLLKTTIKFTEQLLAHGKDNFIVGLTDFHPGGDHLAALRDPQNLAMDLLENLDIVKAKLEASYKEYFQVYDIFYHMLRAADMPITSWTPLIADGRFYIPSNDFSCMISERLFCEVFLPGIVEECRFYDRSIYHLDGPDALRHLDTLLAIDELDAIQWVCGAGNEGYPRWIAIYQKIQEAGKSLQLNITIDELPLVFQTLKPEGVWFAEIAGVTDKQTADAVLKRIEQWA